MSFARRAAYVAAPAALFAADLAAAPAASAAAWPMPPVPSGPYASPTAGQLAALRGCESGGNYAINTGNGFYGAYQFDLSTWRSVGMPGYPNQAPPAAQDRAATILEVQRGWGPWPACSRNLGLATRPASAFAPRTVLPAWTVGAKLSAPLVRSQHPVTYSGHVENAPPGLVVSEQIFRHGAWQTMATTHADERGGWSFTMRPGPTGALQVRAVAAPTGHYRTTPTGALTLQVTR